MGHRPTDIYEERGNVARASACSVGFSRRLLGTQSRHRRDSQMANLRRILGRSSGERSFRVRFHLPVSKLSERKCWRGLSLLEGDAVWLQTLEKFGGLDRTRICDLLRVKQAL